MLMIIKIQSHCLLGEIMYKLEDEKEVNKFIRKEKVAMGFFVFVAVFCTLFKYSWYIVQFYVYDDKDPQVVANLFFLGLSIDKIFCFIVLTLIFVNLLRKLKYFYK